MPALYIDSLRDFLDINPEQLLGKLTKGLAEEGFDTTTLTTFSSSAVESCRWMLRRYHADPNAVTSSSRLTPRTGVRGRETSRCFMPPPVQPLDRAVQPPDSRKALRGTQTPLCYRPVAGFMSFSWP